MDWIPEWIYNYWGGWMSFLALEWVEDIGSGLLAFMIMCTVFFITSYFGIMITGLTNMLTKNFKIYMFIRNICIFGIVVVSIATFGIALYNIHHTWNAYQHWFTTPMGPPLDLGPPPQGLNG